MRRASRAYDRDMLEAYAAHKAEIQEQEEKLEAEKEALDEMQASVEKKQSEVSALASSTSGKISQHVSDIAAAQADLDGKSNTLARPAGSPEAADRGEEENRGPDRGGKGG